MNKLLDRLQVRRPVQEFFEPFFETDEGGNLIFAYGDGQERFGYGHHDLPVSVNFWSAGNRRLAQVRTVVLCASAMEAIAWLNFRGQWITVLENLILLSAGSCLGNAHLDWLQANVAGKSIRFAMGTDADSQLGCLRVACAIRKWPMTVEPQGDVLRIQVGGLVRHCRSAEFSLYRFEKAAQLRFGVAVDRPAHFGSYFEQLRAISLLPLPYKPPGPPV